MIMQQLSELESAEDFLEYFEIQYDPDIVKVSRLHILQRFHDYLSKIDQSSTDTENEIKMIYRELLNKAYLDFVHSNAMTEKVFKVFRRQDPREVHISIEEIRR